MRKILTMIGAILIGACVFASVENSVAAYIKVPPGVYQCAECGIIVRIYDSSTVLDETSFYDGHTHDWRYIGDSKGGTIHPVK